MLSETTLNLLEENFNKMATKIHKKMFKLKNADDLAKIA